MQRRSRTSIAQRRGAVSTVVGLTIISLIILFVLVGYLTYEGSQRSSIEQAANQARQLNIGAAKESIRANASIDASGNLIVNITNGMESPTVEVVDVLVGSVNPNYLIETYSGLEIVIKPNQTYSFDTTVHYTPGSPLWAKALTSLGTSALALFPYPSFSSGTQGGGTSGQIGLSGNYGDIALNFSTFSWYGISTCTPDPNSQESSYCLSPSVGPGNSASTIYFQSTKQPLALVVMVMDVNPEHKSITLDTLTNFLQFQPYGSSIRSYNWFISSNVTTPNSNGQLMNHILNTYQQVTLNYAEPVTLVFGTVSKDPQCTTNCQPAPNFAPVSYAPIAGVAPNLIFAHGWEGIPSTQLANYGQNLPFTSTLYIVPQITLNPTNGPVGTIVTVTGTDFVPSSLVIIYYNSTVVAETTSDITGQITAAITVPPSSGTNTVTATDSSGNSASATFGVWDFSISANPTSLTMLNGGPSRTDTLTISSINGFAGTVELSYSISPSSGLAGSLTPTTVSLGTSGTSTLTLTATAIGTYTVTVTGSATVNGVAITHSISINVAVPSLVISPPSGVPTTQIALSGNNYLTGNSYNYCLSASSTSINSCISGTAHSFTSDSTGGIPSTATLTVPSTARIQTDYVIVYYGTTICSVASFTVQGFDIAPNPPSATVTVGGSPGTSTITVTGLNGFTGTITLGVSTPSGIVASLSTTSISGGSGTSTLTFSGTAAGPYTITVTGSVGSFTNSTRVSVTVSKASPTISTTVSSSGVITLGSSATDTGTFSGGYGTLGGTLIFEAYTSPSCSGTAAFTSSTITVGSGPYTSNAFTPTSSGTYYFQAVYSGDTNNNGFTTCGGAGETLTVQDFTISSSPSSSTIYANGSPGTSTITLSSVNGFTGTVTLSVSTPSGIGASLSSTSVSGGSGTSTLTFSSSLAGTYTITVTGTSGTDTHQASTTVTVNKAITSISTSLSFTSIVATGSVYDSATLSGATSTAGGTVQYEYFASSTCFGTPTSVGSQVTVTNEVVPNSPSQIFKTGGLYGWEAVYLGDQNNAGSTSPCDPLIVEDYGISSTPTTTSVQPGSNASFTITLSSLYNFAGSVALSASSPTCNGCASSTLNPVSLALGGQNTTTLQFISSTTGTFQVNVTGTSSGDTHWVVVTVDVQVASFTAVACSPTSPQAGTSTTCTATVSGVSPTGTVSFSVADGGTGASFSPTTCSLSGGSCSVTYTQSIVGTPTITASYGGDSNNLASSNTTTLAFVQRSSTTSLSCSPLSLKSASSTTCVATVSGSSPTGTVSFETNGVGSFSNGGQCTLSAGSCGVTFTQTTAGTIEINATYSGDSNNLESTSSTVYVTFNPTIVLTPTQGPAGVSVTVSGSGFSPNTTVGTFTFGAVSPMTQNCTSQTTSPSGAFTCSFVVPSSATGSYTVTASGADTATVPSDTASATFTITTPTISLSKTQGPFGTAITVTGSGFSVNTKIGSITFSGGTIISQTCTAQTTSATGGFSCTFAVPPALAGSQLVSVSGSDVGSVSPDTASSSFTITIASLTINPTSCVAGSGSSKCGGTLIALSGSGYALTTQYNYCLSTSQSSISCKSTPGTFTSTSSSGIPSNQKISGSSSWIIATYYVIVYDPSTNTIVATQVFNVT